MYYYQTFYYTTIVLYSCAYSYCNVYYFRHTFSAPPLKVAMYDLAILIMFLIVRSAYNNECAE